MVCLPEAIPVVCYPSADADGVFLYADDPDEILRDGVLQNDAEADKVLPFSDKAAGSVSVEPEVFQWEMRKLPKQANTR